MLPTLPDWPGDDRRRKSAKYLRGATRILDWLQKYPGAGWQQCWDAANGDDKTWMDLLASQDWRLEKTIRAELFTGLRYVLCTRAFRPGFDFFHGNQLDAAGTPDHPDNHLALLLNQFGCVHSVPAAILSGIAANPCGADAVDGLPSHEESGSCSR